MINDKYLTDPRLEGIEKRIDGSLRFFRGLSLRNRWTFEILGTLQILLGAAIPILALQPQANQIYTALAGALVATVKGIDTLGKPQETWLRAAATISRLYSERALFNARAGPYESAKDPVTLYAENVDTVLSGENSQWQQTFKIERQKDS